MGHASRVSPIPGTKRESTSLLPPPKKCPSMSLSNQTPPVSSCIYSSIWQQKDWIVCEQEDFYSTQITAPNIQNPEGNNDGTKEKNRGRGYKHVPHKDKPAPVVARRNARERRRVQAVNSAFAKLRKAVPVENARGKRISKVKTLQNAIDYINNLQSLLEEQDRGYQSLHLISHYYPHRNEDFFYDFQFEDEL